MIEAAIEAAHLRLRPILMTSMAFILGVLPLAIASGAGSASQNAIGTGVIGGMLSATFLATFLIPMFFVVISNKLRRQPKLAARAGRGMKELLTIGSVLVLAACSLAAGLRTAGCTRRRRVPERSRISGNCCGRQPGCGHRLARFSRRSAPAAACRDRAPEQSRPARGGAERCQPSRRNTASSARSLSAGGRFRGRIATPHTRKPFVRRRAHQAARLFRGPVGRVGNRFLRPPAKPEGRGARAVSRDRARAPGRRDPARIPGGGSVPDDARAR